MSCNEWKEYKLGEIMDISSSKRIYAKEYISNGIPFYRGKEIIEKFKGNEVSTELFISEERFKELKEKFGIPKKGDILLTSVGTLGVPYLVQEEEFYFKDGNLTWFKNFNINCCSEFIYYWIQSSYGVNQIYSKSIGSTQKALTIDMLKKFDILLPPLKEQIEISNILSSLDNKIKLNNEMNKTLEEMAQSIFKRWFVDFEFPNEDGEPYKSSGGEMVDSELGMIPKGWEVKSLDDLASCISKGTTPTKKDIDLAQDEQTIKFLKVKDIDDNGNICIDKMENIPASVHYGKLKRSILHTGDIIISIAGTIGKVCAIDERLNNSNMNQAVAFIRLDNIERLFGFILYLLKSDFIQNKIKANIVQAVQANVSLGTLKQLKFAYPNENILSMYNDISMSIYKTQLGNKIEVENLIKVRDSLLPKLMSGEIRV